MKTKFICLLSLLLLFSCDTVNTNTSDPSIVGWWECTSMTLDGKTALTDDYRCFIEFTQENTVAMYDNLFSVPGIGESRKDPVLVQNYWGCYEIYAVDENYLYSYEKDGTYLVCGFFGCPDCDCGYDVHQTVIKKLTHNILELELNFLDESDEEGNHKCIMKFKRSTEPQIVR